MHLLPSKGDPRSPLEVRATDKYGAIYNNRNATSQLIHDYLLILIANRIKQRVRYVIGNAVPCGLFAVWHVGLVRIWHVFICGCCVGLK